MPVMKAEPVVETVVATVPERSKTMVVDGIVWDIKTDRP